MKKTLYALIVIAVIAFITLFIFRPTSEVAVTDFETCAAAGNQVMESYPRRCRHNGQEYAENIGNELEKSDLIRVFSPRPGEMVDGPLKISGEARGSWFFEGSFPVELFDVDGNKIGSSVASAPGEWMTEDFVSFEATLSFSSTPMEKGVLVLKKDNPSGLPENDDALFIPVRFSKQSTGENKETQCTVTGCSGQICSEEEIITTCEYRPEYSCYQSADCEVQTDGKCGWTESLELQACLNSFTQ